MRARIVVAGSVAGLTVLGTGYTLANAATDPAVPTYTGCLALEGSLKGKLGAVAEGSTPTRACTEKERQVRLGGGDITSVGGGTGLRVTSTELGLTDTYGAASLDLAPAYRLPQTCSTGQLVKQAPSGWACTAPPPKRTAYVGRTSTTVHVVGDQYAVLGDGIDLPAGSYAITAKVNVHGDKDAGYGYAECRLDATGSQYLDVASMRIKASSSVPMPLSAAVTKTVPFRVAVLCTDNGYDMSWYQLHIVATPVDDVVTTVLD